MFVSTDGRASILHADLDSFFASVEQRDDPRLRGKPVAVGGGVVLAASYEAKAFGVRSAMNGREARRLCPGLIVADARPDAYSEASRAVFEVFEDTTPLVEALSIDEAFLDVSGLARVSGAPVQIARRLRENVMREVGLPITVGVARTKFLAKVASGVAKPDGLLHVEPERETGLPASPADRTAVGRRAGHVEQAAGQRHRHRRRSRDAGRDAARRRCWARRRAGTCTRSPTTSTPDRYRRGAGGVRWAPNTRSAGGPARTRSSTASPPRWSTG